VSPGDGDDFSLQMEYPSTNQKLEQNIGGFFVAWGVLEREFDTAYPVSFHTNPTLAACLYANLATKAKLDSLKSAVSMLAEALGPRLTSRAHAFLDQAGDCPPRDRRSSRRRLGQKFITGSVIVR
jgi:hypothetical protein